MRVLVINKYVPPEPAPTAVLVGDLAAILRSKGAQVDLLGADVGYRGPRPRGLRRWTHELGVLFRLLLAGMSVTRPDCIICLSDPPGVLLIGAVLAKLKRSKLVHWAMDVYPDTAAALGEIRKGSPIHAVAKSAMSFAYATCTHVACLDQDMLQRLQLHDDPRAFISAPWPPQNLSLPEQPIVPQSKRIRWMYSGNLGRAHEFETLLRAQKLLEDAGQPFDLVFQGGGSAWADARSLAGELGLRHCYWDGYASTDTLVATLLQAHVLIATQRIEVQGLLWPSKLALLRLLPRTILWIGPLNGSIAAELKDSEMLHGVFAPGNFRGLASWLETNAGCFEELSRRPFSPADLGPACANVLQVEGDKWWCRLSSLGPRQTSNPESSNIFFTGKLA